MATPKKPGGPRSASRLAAAQALYQLSMSDEPNADLVTEQYVEHRLGQEIEGQTYVAADEALFRDIVAGAFGRLEEWDPVISDNLSAKWTLERLDPLLHSIARAGTYELACRPDIPTAVIINEYVDVAHAFYDRSETAFVNSLLDKVAKGLRSGG